MPTIVDIATAVAAVCAAVVGIAAASAVVVKLGRWAYAETKRRHRLDRIADLEEPLTQVASIAPQLQQVADLSPALEQVVHELSPNSGTSLFDRVTSMAAYVEELKARERRGRVPESRRPFREPPAVTD